MPVEQLITFRSHTVERRFHGERLSQAVGQDRLACGGERRRFAQPLIPPLREVEQRDVQLTISFHLIHQIW
jgi:hypothetical protein